MKTPLPPPQKKKTLNEHNFVNNEPMTVFFFTINLQIGQAFHWYQLCVCALKKKLIQIYDRHPPPQKQCLNEHNFVNNEPMAISF